MFLSRSKLTVAIQEREVGSHCAKCKKIHAKSKSRVAYRTRKVGSSWQYHGW